MKKPILSILFVAIALLLGYLASDGVNGFLGIKYKSKLTPETDALALSRADTIPTKQADSSPIRSLKLRLADFGGVGIIPDTANWGDNYQHNVHRFEDLITENAPFLDPKAYQRIETELDTFVNRMQTFNINGIVFPAFLELVSFGDCSAGKDIYPDNDPYKLRHLALQKGFGKWMGKIGKKGMDVYLYTDMVALTPPLEKYLLKKYGKIDPETDEFWEVYKEACDEVFTRLPEVSGVMLRIGEAGSIYNKPGWNYYSQLLVRTDKAVEKMLTAFLEVAEKHNKKIIFRTWSVGVGQIGNMHTNPETYERVLGKIQSDNLIISTKYSRGDFYSWLPFNETLKQGKQRRIAEFQLRREFEGLNAFPNYMGPLYQKALLEFAGKNENFDGVWLWTQEGGPLRAGPMSIYPFHGFNTITDLNVYAVGRLVNNPAADLTKITADWVTLNFGDDSLMQKTLTHVLMDSHNTTTKGLYISEFAKYDVRALGLEPPPMLWIFEWDIVGGSPSVFSNIYYITREHISSAISEGFEASEEAQQMLAGLNAVSERVSKNKDKFETLKASLAYEQNLFTTLAHFRKYMLTYYQWMATGDSGLKKTWQTSMLEYAAAERSHTLTYAADLNFPAYNFREANVAAKIAQRTDMSIWLARFLALIIILAFTLGSPLLQKSMPEYKGKRAASMLWYGSIKPSGSSATSCERADTAPLGLFSFVYIILALAVFTSFAAPVFVGALTALTILYIALNMKLASSPGNCDQVAKIASFLSPAMLFLGMLMIFTAWRGPTAFWYFFWTSASFRVVFMMIFVLFYLRAYYTWAVTLTTTLHHPVMKSIGIMLLVKGILFSAGGGVASFFGFEKTLTVLNDELMLLPGGLSRILGITTHLEIPTNIPTVVMYLGLVLVALGSITLAKDRRHRAEGRN
jgi:hypothetical protein